MNMTPMGVWGSMEQDVVEKDGASPSWTKQPMLSGEQSYIQAMFSVPATSPEYATSMNKTSRFQSEAPQQTDCSPVSRVGQLCPSHAKDAAPSVTNETHDLCWSPTTTTATTATTVHPQRLSQSSLVAPLTPPTVATSVWTTTAETPRTKGQQTPIPTTTTTTELCRKATTTDTVTPPRPKFHVSSLSSRTSPLSIVPRYIVIVSSTHCLTTTTTTRSDVVDHEDCHDNDPNDYWYTDDSTKSERTSTGWQRASGEDSVSLLYSNADVDDENCLPEATIRVLEDLFGSMMMSRGQHGDSEDDDDDDDDDDYDSNNLYESDPETLVDSIGSALS